jgi:hypothetical protein
MRTVSSIIGIDFFRRNGKTDNGEMGDTGFEPVTSTVCNETGKNPRRRK